jgi:hypothetical protein
MRKIFALLCILALMASCLPSETVDTDASFPDRDFKDDSIEETDDASHELTAEQDATIPSLQQDFKPSTRVSIPEIEFLRKITEIAEAKGYQDADDELPLTLADFEPEFISKLKEDLEYQDTFPDFEIAEDDIRPEIFEAKAEYIQYMKLKGVHPEYIRQFENSLPDDRIFFYPEFDTDVPQTQIHHHDANDMAGEIDYSQLEMEVYVIDIYNGMDKILDSGITEDESIAKDMAVRTLLYHEYTHVLQRAYDTLNTRTEDRTSKIAWMYVENRLSDADTRYHIDWGPDYADDSADRTVSQESQAEGIAFEILAHQYGLDEREKTILWDYLVGFLDKAKDDFDASVSYLSSIDANIDSIGSKIFNEFIMELAPGVEPAVTLSSLTMRLYSMPAYAGYLHPMKPEDTYKFWEKLVPAPKYQV